MNPGFVIASAAWQSMYFRGAPRWIATAYGLAMTRGRDCPGMTGECAFLAMPAKLLAGHEPRIRHCERSVAALLAVTASVAIHIFSWCAQMDRHGLRPRDDERERVPRDDGRVCVPRDDERERVPWDDGRV